jgi:hypothetical protein
MGFSGQECTECVELCEADAQSEVDRQVVECVEDAEVLCKGGLEGSYALVRVLEACCGQAAGESAVCQRVCGAVSENEVAWTFFEEMCSAQ